MNHIAIAFIACSLAGLTTIIGGIIAVSTKADNKNFLSISLAFSAGVMLFVSLAEIFQKGFNALVDVYTDRTSYFIALGFFFIGAICLFILDKFIEEPFATAPIFITTSLQNSSTKQKAMKLGIFSAISMGLHNFPEGMATFFSMLGNQSFALPLVVAIAIHNLPEGMAVSAPIYYATSSKKKALLASFLSAITEPLGALLSYIFLSKYISPLFFGFVFCIVSGMMTYLSIVEILPTAYKNGKKSQVDISLFVGIAIMGISLALFC